MIDIEVEERNRYGTTLHSFVTHTKNDYVWYKHCERLASVLDRVERGELKRVMIWMPPQNGKSELTSRHFPAHLLYKNPLRRIILVSYAADMAFRLARDARDNYLATGRKLRDDASAVHDWLTEEKGGMLSAGMGGPITGSGGDVQIIDDPIKNAEEAYSLTVQESQWEWYKTTFYTRRRPEAAIIIIMTRWVDNDLCGRLLAQEAELCKNGSSETQNWHIVSFSAEMLEDKLDLPPSCTVEPDWRQIGEPLCPDRYSSIDLSQTKTAVGDEAWWAMYQQRPLRSGGNLWKVDWFTAFDDALFFNNNGHSVTLLNDGCDWDMNDGGDRQDGENAACAYVRSSLGSDGNVYFTDCDFFWLPFPEQVDKMKQIESPHYIENKAAGRSAVTSLMKAGIYASEVKVRGIDKIARTILATPVAQQKKVFIHKRIWDKLLFDERQGILGFPARPFKDLNDAFTQAIQRHYPFTLTPEKPKPEYGTPHDYMVNEVMNKITNIPRQTSNL